MKKEIDDAKLEKLVEERTSELRERNEELKTSEEKYHKMIDEVEDYAIILLDRDGIIQNWNRGAEKIKGYKESEIIGKSFRIFYLPDDLKRGLPDELINRARTEGKVSHEGWRVRKDGTTFWGSVAITALHDDQNNVIGFSKMTRDLTERKLAEDQLTIFTEKLKQTNEELRKSEERYHRMIAEVQDYAIILLNRSGEIENWNIGAQYIKGYTASEILGKHFRIFYPKPDQESGLPERLLNEAAEKGKAVHEGWRVRKDGTRFWGSIIITALHDNDGQVVGFSKVTRDLTERKLAEDQLKEYTRELESQNKELEQFAYIASHDLQEPLRKIQTFTDIIQKNRQDESMVNRYIEKIGASSKRMSELIHSVLNYSRLSKDAEQRSETDLTLLLANVKTDFELLIQEKRAVIKTGPLPTIFANPLQISQLFSNLLSNSLKFATDRPVISIKSRIVGHNQVSILPPLPNGPKFVEIEFSDNGIGFEQQYEKQIFTMFQRLHGRQQYAGTGIGLALCKKIVENHGGYITVKSEPGKGTTFFIYFPL